MIFIFLLALILFGPKRLPHIAREVGKFVAEFKRASNDFKFQLQAEIDKASAESTPAARPQPSLAPPGAQQTETLSQTILPPTSAIPPALAAEAQSEDSAALDAEHQRRMRYARMAFEAQNSTLRPPQPPPVPTIAPQPPPAPAPSAPAVTEPAPAANSVTGSVPSLAADATAHAEEATAASSAATQES